jgi:hypothetical protein
MKKFKTSEASLQFNSAQQTLRSSYPADRKKGESEDATPKKNRAPAEMDRWMSEFYAGARIALEDKPQLPGALGRVVK